MSVVPPSPDAPHQRLFFALWPDQALRQAIAEATARAVRDCGGRPVPVASLHLTLAFLGSVPDSRIPQVDTIARRVAGALTASVPLALTFDHLEHWAGPQVLCAASTAPCAPAAALAALLRRQTQEGGFHPDPRPFREHVTVARQVRHPTDVHDMEKVAWTVAGFTLVASRTESTGPLYSVVESYPLYGPAAP